MPSRGAAASRPIVHVELYVYSYLVWSRLVREVVEAQVTDTLVEAFREACGCRRIPIGALATTQTTPEHMPRATG